MTIQELFIRSNEELRKVVDQIKAEQWDMSMPAGSSRQPTTLHQAINYHTYDDAWVADVLAGKTKAEVGDQFEILLVTDKSESINSYDKHNQLACDAVNSLTELDKMVHLSYGDFSAHDYLQHITSFRAFRFHDIATLIGADTKMPDDFVQALWDEFTPVVEGYRQMGVFPAALEVSEDADLQTKLFALVGRTN
jgi:hypothetical protein